MTWAAWNPSTKSLNPTKHLKTSGSREPHPRQPLLLGQPRRGLGKCRQGGGGAWWMSDLFYLVDVQHQKKKNTQYSYSTILATQPQTKPKYKPTNFLISFQKFRDCLLTGRTPSNAEKRHRKPGSEGRCCTCGPHLRPISHPRPASSMAAGLF